MQLFGAQWFDFKHFSISLPRQFSPPQNTNDYEKEKLPFRAIGGFDPIGQPVELLGTDKRFGENGLRLHRRESETPASVAE